MDRDEIKKMILDCLNELVGDTPVSCQLDAALREHEHKGYASCEDVEALKTEIDKLNQLVGDTTVAEQINTALMK